MSDVNEQLYSEVMEGTDLETVKGIVEKGANVNYKSKGMSVLVQAAQNNLYKIVDYLLDQGADIELKDDNYGMTPLAAAVEQGQLPTVILLLQRGANINTKDSNQLTLKDLAEVSDYDTTEILKILDSPDRVKELEIPQDFFRRWKDEA